MFNKKPKNNLEIPIRYSFSGDVDKARELQGIGKKMMHMLQRSASFQFLSYHKYPDLVFADGSKITCSLNHGIREVHIYRPKGGGASKEKKKECLCNCGFSVGQVVAVREETIDDAPLYDVIACNNETDYVYYENILASDWTPYEIDDVVLLTPYNNALYACCSDLVSTPQGCSPEVSTFATSSNDWRTTYRIIPWCAVTLPKWRYM